MEKCSDDEDCCTPLTLARESSDLLLLPNEDKPIREDSHNEVTTHNSGLEDLHANDTGKPQTFTKLPDEEPINTNIQDQGDGGSGLHPSRSNINVGPTINYGHPGSIQFNNSGIIHAGTSVNFLNDYDDSKSSQQSDSLSEDSPISEGEDADDDYDEEEEYEYDGDEVTTFIETDVTVEQFNYHGSRAGTSVESSDDDDSESSQQSDSLSEYSQISGGEDYDDDYDEDEEYECDYEEVTTFNETKVTFEQFNYQDNREPQTPVESSGQRSAQYSNSSGSGMVTSTFYSSGNRGVQHINTGTRHCQNISIAGQNDNHSTLNGLPIVFQGETLLIGGHIIEGVNATERPLVLTWANDKLNVNGKEQPALGRIEGTGTWHFV